MTKIALKSNDSGTGTFTIEAPVSNNTRTLTLPDVTGDIFTTAGGNITGDFTVDTNTLFVDASTNRVGIGTSSPGTDLHIQSSFPIIRIEDTDAGGAYSEISGNGTEGRLILSADAAGTAANSYMAFRVDAAEAMRIDSSGNLLVGQTSSAIPGAGNTTVGISISNVGLGSFSRSGGVSGTFNRNTSNGTVVAFFRQGVTVGTISVTGTTTSYNTSSDERLKENITDADDASDLIDGIQVRQFDWRADGEHQRYGMVAQELDTVAPEAVTKGETEDDMWAVDYSKLVPMLVKAMQEQQSTINALEARIAALEA